MFHFVRSVLVTTAVAASLTGCVTTNAAMLSPTKYAAVPMEQVRVFLEEDDVPGDYEKIALINSQGSSFSTNEGQMIRKMQKRAGLLGANGIILNDIKEASAGAKVAAAVFGMDTQRKGKVVAIRLRATEPASPAIQSTGN